MSQSEVKKPIPSMTKGEMNPPTVQMAMPNEMALDRIGVGKSSAAVYWLKIYDSHNLIFEYPMVTSMLVTDVGDQMCC